jgi:beta-lactamase class A
MKRTLFLASSLATVVAEYASAEAKRHKNPFGKALPGIERASGGRLGVYALDTGTNQTLKHRSHERFPMCSTFKTLAVGAVLSRVDAGNEDLNRRVAIADADILDYAPVTKAHLRIGSMTIAELCAAAIEWSDNTAANLLLHSLLGPAGVTRFARKIGDTTTRLDRNEPSLNTAIPGDPRDTTTPLAMATDVRALVLGTALKPASRARLTTWLVNAKTGTTRLRAGWPTGWRVGDKTGSGAYNTANDVAVAWPPNRAPWIVAVYYTGSTSNEGVRNRVFPLVAQAVATKFGATA